MAVKPEDLSLILQIYLVDGENLKLSSDFHMCARTHTQIQK